MTFPDFLIVGSMKSGTTSLSRYLSAHKDIYMPARELHYFSGNYNKGVEWYSQWFSDIKHESCVGEHTATYSYGQELPGRIFNLLPDAKLFWVFRDPCYRSYSHYWHRVKQGQECSSFEEAIGLNTGSVENIYERYLEISIYTKQIKRFLEFFQIENMFFVILEDLKDNPESVIQKCYDFLDVDPNCKIQHRKPSNRTYIPRNKYVEFYARKCFGKSNVIYRTIHRFNKSSNPGYPKMKSATSQHLKEYFKEYNRELSVLIDRDLSIWG